MPEPTPCELCGDRTPGAARYDDHDQGWEALCLVCWQLQQPPEPPSLWPRRLGRQGLGRSRRGPERATAANDEEEVG